MGSARNLVTQYPVASMLTTRRTVLPTTEGLGADLWVCRQRDLAVALGAEVGIRAGIWVLVGYGV